MKLKLFMLGIFCLGLAFSTQTQAQTATPKVSKRQVKQKKRIKGGVANGSLTKKETVGLAAQQKAIKRGKKRAKADGKVDRKERVRMHKRQNKASKNIARKKNN